MASDAAGELRRALERNEIVPYFQPLVELRTGCLTGFEALARWHHPSRRMVYPNEFIGTAEEAGLISALTDHIMSRACEAASDWPEGIQLAVNISPYQLRDPNLPERLTDAAANAGFAIDRLVFEITEAALVQDMEPAVSIMGELKALGAQFALDDFGMGYSSLNRLHIFPFDKLKVDASFVRAMAYRRESSKIVAAIVSLGHSLGLSTVAEGVESQAQADMLLCMGCDVGQGWLFGRAVPAEQAMQLLARPEPYAAAQPTEHIAREIAISLEAVPSQRLGQLRALYNGAPVGLGLLDREFRYIALNDRLAAMSNRSVSEHLGRTVRELLPELFARVEQQLRRALAGETVTDFVTRRREANGKDRVFLCSYQPVRDAIGEVTGISVAVVERTGPPSVSVAPRADEQKPKPADADLTLTPRQQDVLQLLVEGHSTKEIARRLGLSLGTIKTHIARTYSTLGARNRFEAIRRARDRGLQGKASSAP